MRVKITKIGNVYSEFTYVTVGWDGEAIGSDGDAPNERLQALPAKKIWDGTVKQPALDFFRLHASWISVSCYKGFEHLVHPISSNIEVAAVPADDLKQATQSDIKLEPSTVVSNIEKLDDVIQSKLTQGAFKVKEPEDAIVLDCVSASVPLFALQAVSANSTSDVAHQPPLKRISSRLHPLSVKSECSPRSEITLTQIEDKPLDGEKSVVVKSRPQSVHYGLLSHTPTAWLSNSVRFRSFSFLVY